MSNVKMFNGKLLYINVNVKNVMSKLYLSIFCKSQNLAFVAATDQCYTKHTVLPVDVNLNLCN